LKILTSALRANPLTAASNNKPRVLQKKTWHRSAMDTSPIIIAGGGIAGLAAALALGSHNALILEQAPAFTSAGAGIQLGPNAVRALQRLGAWDAVEPLTTKPNEIHFRDGLSGRLIKRLVLGPAFAARYGAHYHVTHRASLHAGLLEMVKSKPNVQIECGQMLQHFALGTNDVQFRLKGQNRQAPALIAADGVQSTIRNILLPNSKIETSTSVFHRALMSHPTQSALDLQCVTVWMMPHGHVVHYSLGKHLNVVAVAPKNQTPADFFSNANSALADLLTPAMPQFSTWPAQYVRPLPQWVFGNALLIGDAAHGTLPYMAQGAAMALEDADCLSDAVLQAHSLGHAFAETAKRRMARTQKLHFQTLKTAKVYHAATPIRHLRNQALEWMPDTLFFKNLDWLYKY
jgi:salicylate hydroxylase